MEKINQPVILDPERFYDLAKKDYEKRLDQMYNRENHGAKKIKKRPEDFFKVLRRSSKDYLIFPTLEEAGIDTWEKVTKEAFLVDDKKSEQPARIRDLVVNLHTYCVLECQKDYDAQLQQTEKSETNG